MRISSEHRKISKVFRDSFRITFADVFSSGRVYWDFVGSVGLLKEFFERFTGATERSNFLSSSFVCSISFPFSPFFFFLF